MHSLALYSIVRWTCWDRIPPVGHNICNIRERVGHSNCNGVDGNAVRKEVASGLAIANDVDGNAVRKEVVGVQVKIRLSSQFCAFTCFVLADCALDL